MDFGCTQSLDIVRQCLPRLGETASSIFQRSPDRDGSLNSLLNETLAAYERSVRSPHPTSILEIRILPGMPGKLRKQLINISF